MCFSVSYLARFQSKPSGAAEACLRALLHWLLTRLHRVQTMPSPEGSPSVGPRSVVGFCDAFWNVASVSGGVLMFVGCCIKVFSRNQTRRPRSASARWKGCCVGLVLGLDTNGLSWIRTFQRKLQLLAEEGEMSSLLLEGSVAPEF